jgi:hypothetical protein
MTGDDAGPLERAWICCGFRILERDYFEYPKVFEAEDTIAVLVLPAAWGKSRQLREIACGFGIGKLFCGRYGLLMLIRGILAWPALVGQMAERDREPAGD